MQKGERMRTNKRVFATCGLAMAVAFVMALGGSPAQHTSAQVGAMGPAGAAGGPGAVTPGKAPTSENLPVQSAGTIDPRSLPALAPGTHPDVGGQIHQMPNPVPPQVRNLAKGGNVKPPSAPQGAGPSGGPGPNGGPGHKPLLGSNVVGPLISAGTVAQNINGINNNTQAALPGNPGLLEPPDQGLCASAGFEVEMVNLAVEIYDPLGNPVLGPISAGSFFGEGPTAFPPAPGNFVSDPRCFRDDQAPTGPGGLLAPPAWYAIILSFNSVTLTSHTDILVNNTADPTTPWHKFTFDTTDLGHPLCPCFGDQPVLGMDAVGLYVGTNEFGITSAAFNGAQEYMLSKYRLANLIPGSHVVHFSGFVDPANGGPIISFDPAITPFANPQQDPAEYFMGSNVLDLFSDEIFVGAITNQKGIECPTNLPPGQCPQPFFSFVVIHAPNTGGGPPGDAYFQPSAFPPQQLGGPTLNPDDDRILDVKVDGKGNIWGTLHSAVFNFSLNGVVVPEIFEVQPILGPPGTFQAITGANFESDNILFDLGTTSLFYPSIAVNSNGTVMMEFTATSATTVPSTAYALNPPLITFTPFTGFSIASAGNSAYTGGRWGDYSVVTTLAGSPNFWLAGEFTPDTVAGINWGTNLFEVAP